MSRTQRQLTLEEHKTERIKIGARSHVVVTIVCRLGRYAAIVACAYCAVLVAKALGGQKTELLFAGTLQALAKLDANQYFAWIISVLFGVGWARDSRIKKRRIKKLADQLKTLETSMDPKRTSSGLPEDNSAKDDL